MTGMGAVRSVRALRPLRALRRVPGMPVLVSSILQSLPALGNVAGLSAFLFLVFGIVGMNLFKGVLHYRCADPGVYDLPNLPDPPESGYTLGRQLAGDAAPLVGQLATGAAAHLAATHLPAFKEMLLGVGEYPARGVSKATYASKARVAGRKLKGGGGSTGSADPDDAEAEFDTETFCASDPDMCKEDGTSCFYFQSNPDGGTVSFDNVAIACVAILQVTANTHRG